MKFFICALLASLLFSLGLSACDSDPNHACYVGGDHWEKCSPVQLSGDLHNADAIRARLEGALRTDDGIAINVLCGDCSDKPLGPAITINVRFGTDDQALTTVSRDHWLDDETAQGFVDQALRNTKDRVVQILSVVKAIHHFQDTHPRPAQAQAPAHAPASVAAPVTVTKTVAPPGPPPAPAPSRPILGPFMHVVSIIVELALVLAAVLAALFSVAIFGHDFGQYMSKARLKHRQYREESKARHNATLARIAAQCDQENEDYVAGRRDMFGNKIEELK